VSCLRVRARPCARVCVCVYESTFVCARVSVFIFVGSGRRIDPTAAAAGIRSDRERTDYVDRGLAAAGGGRFGGRDDI